MAKTAKSKTTNLPATMQAAVLRKIGDKLKIERLPVPRPGRGEVLIKVTACGVCHSALHAIDGDWTPLPNLPLTPGHAVAGHGAALGEACRLAPLPRARHPDPLLARQGSGKVTSRPASHDRQRSC